ncbi:MAG: hypothetical protein AVDCRST_MAG30-4047, partial [uncultured Solirubrobacteraceae bacterium]
GPGSGDGGPPRAPRADHPLERAPAAGDEGAVALRRAPAHARRHRADRRRRGRPPRPAPGAERGGRPRGPAARGRRRPRRAAGDEPRGRGHVARADRRLPAPVLRDAGARAAARPRARRRSAL